MNNLATLGYKDGNDNDNTTELECININQLNDGSYLVTELYSDIEWKSSFRTKTDLLNYLAEKL